MGTDSFDSNDFDLFLYQMPDDILLENRYQTHSEDVLNFQELIGPSNSTITELQTPSRWLPRPIPIVDPTTSDLSLSSTTTATEATPLESLNEPFSGPLIEPPLEPPSQVTTLSPSLLNLSNSSTATATATPPPPPPPPLTSAIPPIESLGLTTNSYNQQSNYNYYYCPQGVWPYCLQYCQVHGMQVYPYFNPYVRCTRPGQQVYLSPPPPPPPPPPPLAHQPPAPSSSSSTSSSKRKKRKVQ